MQAAPAQFATQTIRVQFDKDISFGNDVTVRIPKTGDLVNTMFLRVTWPSDLASAVLQPSVGTAMLNRVELMYKDQVLERHYGETMNMLNEITVPQAKQSALTSLIGKGLTSNLASYFIQLPFKTVPLVALDEAPKVRVVFNPSNVFTNVTSYTGSVKLDLFVDYVYVSKAEREYMTSTPLSYFTQTFQLVRFRIPASSYQTTYSLLTQFVNSVSELFWVIQGDNASNVYDYTNTGGTDHLVSLRLTGDMNDLITPDYATPLYLRVIQGLEFHTRVPDSQFYMYSFAIAPEYEQATGTLNFSTFDTQEHDLTLTPSNYGREVRIYARSYNVFHIQRGQGNVLFQAQEGGPVTGVINGVSDGQVFPAPGNGVFSLYYTGTGGTGALGGTSTVADASGNVYTCGTFSTGTLAVYNKNGTLFNTYTRSTGATNTAYVVRYDQSGTAKWVVLMGGPGSSVTNATALRIDSYGDLLVSGTFTAATTETITVYSGATAGGANAGTPFVTTFVTTAGTYDMFLMKLNTAAGTPQWALPIASPPPSAVYSFTATGVQNVPAGTYNYFLIGGGSGGSGGHTGGGGAGSISTGTFTYAGGNLSVTVGTGGTAGIGNNGVGGNGNSTTINTGVNPTVAGGVGNNNGGSGSSGGGGYGNAGFAGAGGSNGSNGSPGASATGGTGQGTTLVTNARASLQAGLTLLYPTATATAGLGGAAGTTSHAGGGGGGGIVVTNVPSVTSPTAANGVNALSGRGGVGFGAAGGAGGYDGTYYNGGAGAAGIAVIWAAGTVPGSEGADANLALPVYKNLLSLSSDLAGNVYVAFTSNSTVVATSGVSRSTIGTTYSGSTSGVYSPHTYIAQFAKAGTFNWISGVAGTPSGNVFVTSTSTSNNGLTAVTGYFTSNTFAPFNSAGALSSGYRLTRSDTTSGLYPAPVNITLPTVNSFVATYTSVGNIQMLAQQVSSNIQSLGVTYDAASNIITCGTVRGYGALLYDTSAASAPPGLTGISTAFQCPTTTDTYGILVKYSITGYPIWTNVIGSASGLTVPSACTTDASSSVYACGFYTCPVCTIGAASFTRLGTQDAFVVKYSSTSAYVWAVRIGSTGSTVACRSIAIDPLTQNVIVSGTYTAASNQVVVYTVSGVPSGVTLPVTSVAMPFTIELKAS